MGETQIYSPNQILVGSILGGPVTSVVMLERNFVVLGESATAKKTIIWGGILTVGILAAAYIVSTSFPNSSPTPALPIIYALFAKMIAKQYQLSKEAIATSDRYSFRSNLHVVGLSVALLAATFVALFVLGLLLVATGII